MVYFLAWLKTISKSLIIVTFEGFERTRMFDVPNNKTQYHLPLQVIISNRYCLGSFDLNAKRNIIRLLDLFPLLRTLLTKNMECSILMNSYQSHDQNNVLIFFRISSAYALWNFSIRYPTLFLVHFYSRKFLIKSYNSRNGKINATLWVDLSRNQRNIGGKKRYYNKG